MLQDTAGAGPSVYGPWVETDRKGVNTKDKLEYLYPGQPAQVKPQPPHLALRGPVKTCMFFFPSVVSLICVTLVCIKLAVD
jgi:hypothetical protein